MSLQTPNCEYPLREWTSSEAIHSLAPSHLVAQVKIFSIFVRLMQVQRLHSCHETCRKEQVCVPSVQSQDIASSCWLGDIEKMERKMLGAFSSHFLNVGYSKR
jgi:hypothetical protein